MSYTNVNTMGLAKQEYIESAKAQNKAGNSRGTSVPFGLSDPFSIVRNVLSVGVGAGVLKAVAGIAVLSPVGLIGGAALGFGGLYAIRDVHSRVSSFRKRRAENKAKVHKDTANRLERHPNSLQVLKEISKDLILSGDKLFSAELKLSQMRKGRVDKELVNEQKQLVNELKQLQSHLLNVEGNIVKILKTKSKGASFSAANNSNSQGVKTQAQQKNVQHVREMLSNIKLTNVKKWEQNTFNIDKNR